MANLVDAEEPVQPVQSPEQPQYSTDQWIAWLQEDEGRGHVAQGLPLLAEGMEALYAVMQKGKGKGSWQNGGWQVKGKDGKSFGKGLGKQNKGKGKGNNWNEKRNFIRKCNRCGKSGHMARDCPDAALSPIDQNWIGSDWNPGKPSLDAQSPQSGVNMVTLCLNQDSTLDYRLNKNAGLVNHLKFVPTRTIKKCPIEVNVGDTSIEVNQFPSLDKPVTLIKKKKNQTLKYQETQ